MKAIYASKLYRTSSRKNKIHAAIENPVNGELISQLAIYLDEEYQTPEYLEESPAQAEAEGSEDGQLPDDLDPGASEGFSPSDNLVHVPSGGGGGLPPMPDDVDTDPFSEDEDTGEDLDGGDLYESPDLGTDEPVEESTAIMCNTDIDAQALKGALNAQQDTAGVSRIATKENEVWIYYNDDINLNNIMVQVIEYMNAASYTFLEFNRLARSDNAIVFQITDPQPVKSIEDNDEK